MRQDSMMRDYCMRCGQPTHGCTIMSMFNNDVICIDCMKKEKENPRYKEAVEAERKACAHGNYNFKGIGW